MSDIFNYCKLGVFPSTYRVQQDVHTGTVLAAWNMDCTGIIQLCGGVPSQQITHMEISIQAVSTDAVEVEIETALYYLARTIDFNHGIISNDLMDVFDEDDFTGTTLFLFQVQFARKKGFHELRTRAQSREIDTGIPGRDWDGYYRWARLGYQMYDPTQLKRLKQLMQQGSRPEKDLSELVLSMDNDDGYEFWKLAARNFTWDGKFELKDNSDSMKHLLKYLRKKKINNYVP